MTDELEWAEANTINGFPIPLPKTSPDIRLALEYAEKAGRYEAALWMIEYAFRQPAGLTTQAVHAALIAAGLRPISEIP